MRLSKILTGGVVLALGSLPGAEAWGAAGHEIVATIAQIHLQPSVLPILCSILYPDSASSTCFLAPVSTWADRYKYRMRWSAALHYVGALGDHPSDTCLFPGARGWAGRTGNNVLSGIRNTTTLLGEFVRDTGDVAAVRASDDLGTAQEALKFLIHFVGDLHQPLHLTGRDRGGNSDKVSWNGRVTNLHSLWDGLLIAKALRGIPSWSNYSRPLPIREVEAALRGAIYDPYVRRLMWEGVGVGAASARWEDEIESWLDCPAPAPESGFLQRIAQVVFGGGGAPEGADDAQLCPYAWATPIHALNCDLVWPRELDEPPYSHDATAHGEEDVHVHMHDDDEGWVFADAQPRGTYLELDTPAYAGRIEREWVVERLLAQGGIRLAGVLNDIFAPLVEDGLEH